MYHQQIITMFFIFSFLQQTVTGSLIIGGDIVPHDAMQYMASVRNIKTHVCGGILVSENLVLTAAHCDDKHPKEVVLGKHTLKTLKKPDKIKIKETIKHPSYKKRNEGHDLMLLKLKEKVKLGNGVQKIQLPNEGTKVEVNEWCQVAGWGATKVGSSTVDKLMVTGVSIIDTQTCKKEWPSLPPNVICACGKNNSRTFNEGDCGGPLVCNNITVGIASFNRIGAKEGPNVFVDILNYLPWIKEIINKN